MRLGEIADQAGFRRDDPAAAAQFHQGDGGGDRLEAVDWRRRLGDFEQSTVGRVPPVGGQPGGGVAEAVDHVLCKSLDVINLAWPFRVPSPSLVPW